MSIYDEIKTERDYQDGKWGTLFDDKNSPDNWVFYIIGYLGNLYRERQPFRIVMLKVAALAVASIEAYDRKVAV